MCLGSYRIEFSGKQCNDFLRYLDFLLLQFLDVLYQLQDARCLWSVVSRGEPIFFFFIGIVINRSP